MRSHGTRSQTKWSASISTPTSPADVATRNAGLSGGSACPVKPNSCSLCSNLLALVHAAGAHKQFRRIDVDLLVSSLLVPHRQNLDRFRYALRAWTGAVVLLLPAIAENHHARGPTFRRQCERSFGKLSVMIFLSQWSDAQLLAGVQPLGSRVVVAPVFFFKTERLATVLFRRPLALRCGKRQDDEARQRCPIFRPKRGLALDCSQQVRERRNKMCFVENDQRIHAEQARMIGPHLT